MDARAARRTGDGVSIESASSLGFVRSAGRFVSLEGEKNISRRIQVERVKKRAAVVRVGAAFEEELAELRGAAGDRRGERGRAAREARGGRSARVEERARDAIRAGGFRYRFFG